MNMPTRHRRRVLRRAHGISLIEVLVVLVLFSIGLIGMIGLQARAVQVSVGAEDSSRAALLATDVASRLWAARSTALDPADLAAWNLRVADVNQGGLPNGVGAVTVAGTIATITVSWRAPHEPTTTSHNYQTQLVIP